MQVVPPRPRIHTGLWVVLGTGALLFSIVLGVCLGPVQIPLAEVWQVITAQLLGGDAGLPDATVSIVWYLRVPRVLLGAMVGISLAVSGVAMQAFTKNVLADPYVLGVSSGASLGAVLAMSSTVAGGLGAAKVPLAAFAGAVVAILLVYLLARTTAEVSPIRLVLVGIAVSATFTAFTNFTVYNAPDDAKVREATFWMLGGVAGVEWPALIPLAVVLGPALVTLFVLGPHLNAMMMGDAAATTLGVNVNQTRRVLIVATALLTGVSVAVSGAIGFVGLVVPHIVRSVVGADHRRVLPLAALGGGIFLVWVDVAARLIDIPKEIPLGILTSMIGAPVFLWMIRTRRYAFGG